MKRISKVFALCLIGCFALVLASMSLSGEDVTTYNVSLSPHKIILNAPCTTGKNQDIQAIVRIPESDIPEGCVIGDMLVKLTLGDKFVAENVRYCYIDDNLLCSFNRFDIQNSEAVQSLAGSIVTATIEGWWFAPTDPEVPGDPDFTGSDKSVEIVAPGKAGTSNK